MRYILDLEDFTLDGNEILLDDIVILMGRYHFKHPEDKHFEEVLAKLCYGRFSKELNVDNKIPEFDVIVFRAQDDAKVKKFRSQSEMLEFAKKKGGELRLQEGQFIIHIPTFMERAMTEGEAKRKSKPYKKRGKRVSSSQSRRAAFTLDKDCIVD